MAQSTRTTTKKKRKSSPTGKSSASRPVRREVGALVSFFLAVFGILGFFGIDAFLSIFSAFCWAGFWAGGYYMFPPMLLVGAWILATHRGRPVTLRLICALLAPVSLGTLLFLLFNKTDYAWSWRIFPELWKAGAVPGNAGAITGILGMSFKVVFSKIGAVIVFIVLTLFLVFVSFNISVSAIRNLFRRRERPAYEFPEAQEMPKYGPDPVRKGRSRRVIDLPLDEPSTRYVEEKEPRRRSARA